MKSKITSYKDLIVWQKAVSLAVEIYKTTETFPIVEQYGLTSQMRRSSVSVASNIAEGRNRGSRADFARFLIIACGSGSELETQISIVKLLPFGSKVSFTKIDSLLEEVMKMLNTIISKLQANS